MPRALVAAVAVLAIACANPFSSEPEPTARELLTTHAAVTHEPAVAVPTVLPAGYRMLWASMYFSEDEGLPGVEVCVARSPKELVGGCVGSEDVSPWASFELDGLTVVVSTLSDPEQAEFLQPWIESEWTTSWRTVGWIDSTFSGPARG